MTWLDGGVIAILLVSLLIGIWRGLLYEVLSLAGWPVAFLLSKLFAERIAPLLTPVLSHVEGIQEPMRIAAAYALVFIVALIAWGIAARLISKMFKAIGSVSTDRAMGAMFGVLRGGLVVLVLTWLAGLTQLPQQPIWRGAASSKTLEDIALLTKIWLPDDIAQRVRYGARGTNN